MPRLFIFAIGGTGSRVVKSLTMLLASGVKAKQDYEIVPIIIDPHDTNEDMKRTITLLENYQKVTDKVGTDSGFFGTKVTTLDRLVAGENQIGGSFGFKLQDIANKKFKDYIDHSILPDTNKDIVDLLFSGISKNQRGEDISLLDIDMSIGFVGNPNIGSIVLNQFKDSEEFKTFENSFSNSDRIFIVSSIFGGTGAAGFPTILKNIRAKPGFLANSKIGAITVMPYFNIATDDGSPIQKSDFISKTKAALHYYKNNVNDDVNTLYYIADPIIGKPILNDPGNNGQKNPAHPVDLFSALAIIDFLNIDDNELNTNNGKPTKPIFKEFGLKNNADSIKFSDLEDNTAEMIAIPIAQFAIFIKFCKNYLKDSLSQAWATDKNANKSTNAPKADEYIFSAYKQVLTAYEEWLTEMDTNKRGFSAVNIYRELAHIIDGKEGKYGLVFKSKSDEARLNGLLNTFANGKSFDNPAQRITKVFFEGTKEILNKDFAL